MNDAQIKHMVDRFLGWKLPKSFSPDGGVSFKRTFNDHLPQPMKHEPSGTNLFDATQARAMVLHMLEGMPSASNENEHRAAICDALLNAFPMDDKQADAYASVAAKVIATRRPTLSDEAVERAMAAHASAIAEWMAHPEAPLVSMPHPMRAALTAAFSPPERETNSGATEVLATDPLRSGSAKGNEAGSVAPEPAPSSMVPVEAVGWQPIDTAPKDGRMLLLYNLAHDEQMVLGWTADPGMPDLFPVGCWTDAGSQNRAINLTINGGYFQFWMPLPAAPSHMEKVE